MPILYKHLCSSDVCMLYILVVIVIQLTVYHAYVTLYFIAIVIYILHLDVGNVF